MKYILLSLFFFFNLSLNLSCKEQDFPSSTSLPSSTQFIDQVEQITNINKVLSNSPSQSLVSGEIIKIITKINQVIIEEISNGKKDLSLHLEHLKRIFSVYKELENAESIDDQKEIFLSITNNLIEISANEINKTHIQQNKKQTQIELNNQLNNLLMLSFLNSKSNEIRYMVPNQYQFNSPEEMNKELITMTYIFKNFDQAKKEFHRESQQKEFLDSTFISTFNLKSDFLEVLIKKSNLLTENQKHSIIDEINSKVAHSNDKQKTLNGFLTGHLQNIDAVKLSALREKANTFFTELNNQENNFINIAVKMSYTNFEDCYPFSLFSHTSDTKDFLQTIMKNNMKTLNFFSHYLIQSQKNLLIKNISLPAFKHNLELFLKGLGMLEYYGFYMDEILNKYFMAIRERTLKDLALHLESLKSKFAIIKNNYSSLSNPTTYFSNTLSKLDQTLLNLDLFLHNITNIRSAHQLMYLSHFGKQKLERFAQDMNNLDLDLEIHCSFNTNPDDTSILSLLDDILEEFTPNNFNPSPTMQNFLL